MLKGRRHVKAVSVLREKGVPLHLRDRVLTLATHTQDKAHCLALWLPGMAGQLAAGSVSCQGHAAEQGDEPLFAVDV